MRRSKSKPKSAPKRVLRLPDLDHTKLSLLNTLGSPQSQRAYGIAIDDFIAWYCSEPRIAFKVIRTKTWARANLPGKCPCMRKRLSEAGLLMEGAARSSAIFWGRGIIRSAAR